MPPKREHRPRSVVVGVGVVIVVVMTTGPWSVVTGGGVGVVCCCSLCITGIQDLYSSEFISMSQRGHPCSYKQVRVVNFVCNCSYKETRGVNFESLCVTAATRKQEL